MKRILIAYDGSDGAEAALLDIRRAGLPARAEANVLSLADVWLPPEEERTTAGLSPEIAERCRRLWKNALETLSAAKATAVEGARKVHGIFPEWHVESVARPDSPSWAIIAEAKAWKADLIVLGSHGRGPLQKFFLGSVSQKVISEADCSVRVVRPHEHAPNRRLTILAGLDGSHDADAAMMEILSRSWPAGTSFELISVADPALRPAPLWKPPMLWDQPPLGEGEDWVQPMLAHYAEKLQRLEWPVRTHIMEGDPKAILLRLAAEWNVDAIFLGARGVQHGQRYCLGTLASAVATRAHCAVEIVRPARLGAPPD